MSKQIEAALADSTDDSEAEEYFATNREHSHIPPRHSSSRKRGAAVTKEQEEPELPVKLHEEDEEMGHHSPDRSLVNMGWSGPEEKENLNTPISAYLNAFFMTIATVLGTGILALPVKLSKSGFTPLLATYTFIFVMQCGLMLFLVEVLQRARLQFQKKKSEEGENMDDLPLVSSSEAITRDEEDEEKDDTIVELNVEDYRPSSPTRDEKAHTNGCDLHSISVAYLPRLLRYFFDCGIVLHFVSLLITYTLAASEGYGQLFGMHLHWIWLAIPFVGLLSNMVIFGSQYLDSFISILTFSKAGLLVLMVVITGIVSTSITQHVSDDWKYIGRPFLIGTVALGGIYNILPVAFEKVRFHSGQIKIFTACAIAGLTLVYLFNLGWCFFVLKIVPQMPPPGSPPMKDGDLVMTLYDAEKDGQISTVPLVNIIRRDAPKFRWIAVVVMLFTIVSITVSFIVNSMGWKHYLEGLAAAFGPTKETSTNWFKRAYYAARNLSLNWKRAILFASSFSFILLVALLNPKSFLKIMEKVTSFAANGTAAGVVWMLHTSRVISPGIIPWAMPPWLWKGRWVVLIFFLGAMLYNLVSTIAEAAGVDWL